MRETQAQPLVSHRRLPVSFLSSREEWLSCVSRLDPGGHFGELQEAGSSEPP
jgi:hypothetical protein